MGGLEEYGERKSEPRLITNTLVNSHNPSLRFLRADSTAILYTDQSARFAASTLTMHRWSPGVMTQRVLSQP